MEYIYSALLLHGAGQKIDEAGLKKVMEAAGSKPDAARIKALVSSLDGVNIEEAIAQAALPSAAAVAAPVTEEKAEENKEEKKAEEDEKKAEEAAAGLGSLFG